MNPGQAAALAAMAITLGLGGCGGGADSPAGSSSSTSSGSSSSSSSSIRGSLMQDLTGHTLMTLDYGAFTLRYDCTDRTALRYDYTLQADTGSAARPGSYTFDPTLPAGCNQQTSTKTYASVQSGWDLGHLVTSNHMDIDLATIRKANYMTNIVPQASAFNQGIWTDTEELAECERDYAPVRVLGGVTYSLDAAGVANDYFVQSHGIRTPEWFWKLLLTNEAGSTSTTTFTRAIAWLIPNRSDVGSSLDPYLISIDELEQKVGSLGLDLPASLRSGRPTGLWTKRPECTKTTGDGSSGNL